MSHAAAVAVALMLLAACGSAPPTSPEYSAREVVELARWQALAGERPVAIVRRLEIRDPVQPIVYYRVEDLGGRWLGHATDNGRFSRRVPFRDDEEDLGVWSLPKGVQLLLALDAPVRLQEVAPPTQAAPR